MTDISKGGTGLKARAKRAIGLQLGIESSVFNTPETEVLRMLLLADTPLSGYDLKENVRKAPEGTYQIRPRYNTTIEALRSLESKQLVELKPSLEERRRHRGVTRLHRKPYALTLAGFVMAFGQNPKLQRGQTLDEIILRHKEVLPELFSDWGAVAPEDMDTERSAIRGALVDAARSLQFEVFRHGDPSFVYALDLRARIPLKEFLIREFIMRRGDEPQRTALGALPPFIRDARTLATIRDSFDRQIGEAEKRLVHLKVLRARIG